MQKPDTGLRYDTGKLRYDLLPPDAVAELVAVFTRGAEKYAPRNWEKGMDWQRCFAALQRHAAAWQMGEDRDPETGCLHMAHVAWNALALVTYQLRGVGEDDRPKLSAPVAGEAEPFTFVEVSQPDYPRYDGDIVAAAKQVWDFFKDRRDAPKGARPEDEHPV